MKRFLSLMLLAGLLITAPSFAAPQHKEDKAAVVDIQKVMDNFSDIKTIRKEEKNNIKELEQFIKKANKDIDATKDTAKKKALSQKYEKELTAMRNNQSKKLNEKTVQADVKIARAIAIKASENGYTVVLYKSAALYGANDITDEVIKALK